MKIKYYSIWCLIWILPLICACRTQSDALRQPDSLTSSTSPVSSSTPIPQIIDPQVISAENIYNLEIIDRHGTGNLYGFALSPDKQTMAVAMTTGVYLYDINSKEEILFINWPAEKWSNVNKNPYCPLSFSPDGNLLAIGYKDIILWNIENNRYVKRIYINVDEFTPVDVRFTPDGQTIAVLTSGFYPAYDSPGGSFSLYTISTGERIFNEIYYPNPYYENNNFYFLTDNRIMFASTNSYNNRWGYYVSIINANTGALLDHYEYDNYITRANYDGTIFAIQPDFDGFYDIVDTKTGQMFPDVKKAIAFIPGERNRQLQNLDNHWTVLENFEKTICTIESDEIPDYYDTREFHFFYNTLVIWDVMDLQIRGWDLATCDPLFELKVPISDKIIMVNLQEGIFINEDPDFLELQSGNNEKKSFYLKEYNSNNLNLHWALSLDEKTLILLNPQHADNLEVWNIPSAKRIKVINTGNEDYGPPDLGLSTDGKMIIFSGSFGIQLWDTNTGEMKKEIPSINGSISLNPNGEEFAILNDTTLYIIALQTGTIEKIIKFNQHTPYITFSYDWSNFFYRDNNNDEICYRNIATGLDIVLHEMPDINFNPNKQDSAPTSILSGLYIQSYAINKDGSMFAGIVNTDQGYSLRFWNLTNGKTIRDISLPIHHTVESFSDNGKYLTTSYENVYYVWGISEEKGE